MVIKGEAEYSPCASVHPMRSCRHLFVCNLICFCYNSCMKLIDELESRAVTEIEIKELIVQYDSLYIEETDKQKSDEYFDLDLYLNARLAGIEEAKENESNEIKEMKARIRELEAENRALYKRAKGGCDDYLSKQDIMLKFSKGSDWALRLLKLMFQTGKASKIGREYYASESDIFSFLQNYKGKALLI